MNKLEETLNLIDIVEKNPNNLLSDKVQGLLKENDYYLSKKKLGIEFYRKRGKGNEVFIEYNHYRNHNYSNYCFAVLKENNDGTCHAFCKSFKRYHGNHDFLGLASFFGPFSAGTLGLAYVGLSSGIDPGVTAILSFIISGALTIPISSILEGYFVNRRKTRMEESCKELYYGKEALEKAFGGKK